MDRYAGPQSGDMRPKGGGKHNLAELGHEAFNFFPDFGDTLYGTFGIVHRNAVNPRIDLRKIDPAISSEAESLDGVLVIFVAPYDGETRIVGWYRDGTVHRRAVPYPQGVRDRIQQYFAGQGINDSTFNVYRLEAKSSSAVLLPANSRKSGPRVPHGSGGMGQSNVCYAYTNGVLKTSPWIQKALDFVIGYHGLNLLTDSEAQAEAASFLAQEEAAGFQSNAEIRRIVEKYAMDRAKEKLRGFGFGKFHDTHTQKCYDYTCERDGGLYYVEVKGTQGPGASVILTKNEVEHWKEHQKHSIAVVVYNVRLDAKGESFLPSEGTARVLFPWILELASLEPIQYNWTVSERPELPGA